MLCKPYVNSKKKLLTIKVWNQARGLCFPKSFLHLSTFHLITFLFYNEKKPWGRLFLVISPFFGKKKHRYMSLCLTVGKMFIFKEFYGIYTNFFKRNLVNVALAMFTMRFLPFGLDPWRGKGWSNFLLSLKPKKIERNLHHPFPRCFPESLPNF